MRNRFSSMQGPPGPRGLPGFDGDPAKPAEIPAQLADALHDLAATLRIERAAAPAPLPARIEQREPAPPAPRQPWRLIPVRDENTDLILYVDLVPL